MKLPNLILLKMSYVASRIMQGIRAVRVIVDFTGRKRNRRAKRALKCVGQIRSRGDRGEGSRYADSNISQVNFVMGRSPVSVNRDACQFVEQICAPSI